MSNTLVDVYDLADFPGGTDAGQFNQTFIDAAVARIRAHVGWHIAPVVSETVYVSTRDGRTFDVPTLRLVSVSEIRWAGFTYHPGDYTIYRNGVVALNRWPRYYFPGFAEAGEAELDITHGYPQCPPELLPKIASLVLASSSPRDPSLSRMIVGQVQMQYDQRAAGSLDADDVLERYRLPAGVA
jgi:hypothetical protein